MLDLKGRAELFDVAGLERMLHHFTVLLRAIVQDPQRPVARLPLLERGEGANPCDDNPTQAHFPDVRIDELIRAQAAHTPHAIAVEYDGVDGERETLEYGELVARAERVAQHLRALGVGPGVGVGLFFERSLEQVVGILGVLTAGGYYVPLDPDYPPERLAFMLADAGVPVVVTLERLRAAFHAFAGTGGPAVVALDAPAAAPNAAMSDKHERPPSPDDLAYAIYTSGSTGRPKGVMVAHRALVNYAMWMKAAYGIDARDAILQRAPASFDASVWEFFVPLIAGARLVLARRGAQSDPAYLRDVLERGAVSLLQLVPAQLAALIDVPGIAPLLGGLRRLFLGGEALPSDLLGRLLQACPQLAVTNLYGPTEATVYATHWDVDRGVWDGGAVPLGIPIANVTIHVLDAQLEPVPPGIVGELCIGGAGLAQGYLGRPDLTAERFVEVDRDGVTVRLYRTGDRARRRVDGTLEFLGRLDTQIKLHGFRIELGEIEHALGSDPDVRSAVVVIREAAGGDGQLAAYCLPARGSADAATNDGRTELVRGRLANRLPAFMLPAAIVWLDAWPLGATGKLDRAALPAPPGIGTRSRIIVAPQTPTETRLAALWSAALGLEEIGTSENFFDLGGHSLVAMRIVARIEEAFGTQVPLRTFFERPTVAQMADHVDELRRSGRAVAGPALRRITRPGTLDRMSP